MLGKVDRRDLVCFSSQNHLECLFKGVADLQPAICHKGNHAVIMRCV